MLQCKQHVFINLCSGSVQAECHNLRSRDVYCVLKIKMTDYRKVTIMTRNFTSWLMKPLLILAIAVPAFASVNVSNAEAGSKYKRAAIIAGAIVGGVIAHRAYKRSNRHYRYNRYHAPRHRAHRVYRHGHYSGHRHHARHYNRHYGHRIGIGTKSIREDK